MIMSWSSGMPELSSPNDNFTIPVCGKMSEDSFNLLMAVSQAVAVPLNFFTLLVLLSLRSATGNGLVLCAASFWDLVCTINCCLFWYSTLDLPSSAVVKDVTFTCLVNSGIWLVAETEAWLGYTAVALWRFLLVTKPFLSERLFTSTNTARLQAVLLLLGMGIAAPLTVCCYIQKAYQRRVELFFMLVVMSLFFGSVMVFCYARVGVHLRRRQRQLNSSLTREQVVSNRRIEAVLVATCVLFLAFNLPYIVFYCLVYENNAIKAQLPCLGMWSIYMHETSFGLGGMVFLVGWPKFRQRARTMLTPPCFKHAAQKPSTNSTLYTVN